MSPEGTVDTATPATTLAIDVFSDVVCPWCYIGERRLARGLELARARHPALEVDLRWRPYQLRPDMPSEGEAWATFVREKFGGEERARAMFAQVAAIGAAEGLTFRFDRVASSPNTVDAHRLILAAADAGREWAMATALFQAYFAEGATLNDPEQLVEIATRAGLGADEARAHLAGDDGKAEVVRSQLSAGRLGIQGVPFYVVGGRLGVSGAQPPELFARVVAQALEGSEPRAHSREP
jgi:predicted DsbA family dithiol-disulfide isomerase